MSLEKARFNMVEQQIRPWEVLDSKVLDLMRKLPRELFVPKKYQQLAYSDISIPLTKSVALLPPKEIGRLLQALSVQSSDLVLEVGAGTGYLTTLLARQAAHVLSIEKNQTLLNKAQKNIDLLHIKNVTLVQGDAAKGWEPAGPYNIICITGALPILPDSFKKSLLLGGRLFVIIGNSPCMKALLITRLAADEWQTLTLFETVTPYLQNINPPSIFEF